MTVDYTDIIARFTDEVAARTLAEFISSAGVPCDLVEMWDPTRFERYGIRVQRSRIADLRQTLDLTSVSTRQTFLAAQLLAGRLAREGVPSYVGGLHMHGALAADSDVPIRETDVGWAGVDCMVAVPRQFVQTALRLLNVAPISEDELAKLALEKDAASSDSD